MPKISTADEADITKTLRRWALTRKLSWDLLRESLAQSMNVPIERIWSRQSLSSNETISTAFKVAKERLSIGRKTQRIKVADDTEYENIISNLRSELSETKLKYETLLLRHTQLCYNVSLFENLTTLLDGPLPDNTRSQG